MNTENNDVTRDGQAERRKNKRPHRRLVDLTLARGTDKRETREDRRKESSDEATERQGEEDDEQHRPCD